MQFVRVHMHVTKYINKTFPNSTKILQRQISRFASNIRMVYKFYDIQTTSLEFPSDMTFVEFGRCCHPKADEDPTMADTTKRKKERGTCVLSRLKWLGLGRAGGKGKREGGRWGSERYRALTWSPCGYRIPYQVGLVFRSKGPSKQPDPFRVHGGRKITRYAYMSGYSFAFLLFIWWLQRSCTLTILTRKRNLSWDNGF